MLPRYGSNAELCRSCEATFFACNANPNSPTTAKISPMGRAWPLALAGAAPVSGSSVPEMLDTTIGGGKAARGASCRMRWPEVADWVAGAVGGASCRMRWPDASNPPKGAIGGVSWRMRWPDAWTLETGAFGGASRRIKLLAPFLAFSFFIAATIGASRRINGVLTLEASVAFACKASGSSRRTSGAGDNVDAVCPCMHINSAPPMRRVARKAVTSQSGTNSDSFGAVAESATVEAPEAISCEGCGNDESTSARWCVGLEAQLETMQ